MSKFDDDKLVWDSFQHNRSTLYTAINVLHKQGNITLEATNYLLSYLEDMDVYFREAYDTVENLLDDEEEKSKKRILRQCRKFVNMSNRWSREKMLEEREELLPKLEEF